MWEVPKVKELILKTLLEGVGLSILLILVCAIGIKNGAVGRANLR